jgi:signal transduction histidine kinase
MGLEELAAVISVGGFPVLVISGQYSPPEGISDVLHAIDCLGRSTPTPEQMSAEMATSALKFNYPAALWTETDVSQEARQKLRHLAGRLSSMEPDFEHRLLDQARRIREIAQSYFDLAKGKAEAEIIQRTTQAATKAMTTDLRKTIAPAFQVLMEGLNVAYVAFFYGATDFDTTLSPGVYVHAAAASPPLPSVHFNWRKAGLRTEDERDTHDQTLHYDEVGLSDRRQMERGFRRTNPFPDATAIVPVRLPTGPFGVVVLGPQRDNVNLSLYEQFVLTAARDLGTRTLTLQLAHILETGRTDWENTARLTGHRVRASIQGIRSQLSTIKAVHKGEKGFTAADRLAADTDLERGFRNLIEVSYGAESAVASLLDPKVASREFIPLSELVLSAVEDQQDLADQSLIEIDVSPKLIGLPSVYVNRTLMRLAFVNLINNGIKYSWSPTGERRRPLRIRAKQQDSGYVMVEIENFGLGIPASDQARVFDWGVRLADLHPAFKHVFGKGFGLWEVRYVIQGHGGHVELSSEHYRSEAMTCDNLHQCITRFCVTLPSIMTRELQGGQDELHRSLG